MLKNLLTLMMMAAFGLAVSGTMVGCEMTEDEGVGEDEVIETNIDEDI